MHTCIYIPIHLCVCIHSYNIHTHLCNICLYANISTCIQHIYSCTFTYIWTHECLSTCIHICLHTYMHMHRTYMNACSHTYRCLHVCLHIHIHIYIQKDMQILIYVCLCTYMHTYRFMHAYLFYIY